MIFICIRTTTRKRSNGVDLQVGTLPTGVNFIPSEYVDMVTSEVIMLSLKQHPDWIPWIDHSTTPPTFNVTKVGDMSAVSLNVNGGDPVLNFNVIQRDDLLPESVRIVYEYASQFDSEVYRNIVIDKYPADGPDAGPGVLQASVPLSGTQMQIQKSRVQTRLLPTSQETAKEWLKLKFPYLRNVRDTVFNVTEWSKELVVDDEEHPEPINPNATRITVDDADDLHRELIRGSIEDWMQRKVGEVLIKAAIEPTGSPTIEEIEAINIGVPPIKVTATNALTKVYKGITQWTPAAEPPSGIAEQTYRAIYASMPHQGTLTLLEQEVGTSTYHGRKLNLTGGYITWASMNAPIHSVDFDIEAGTTTLSFGPVPHLAPADFIEMERMLRYRPITWWTFEERASKLIGAEGSASAKGDTVDGYDTPVSVTYGGGNSSPSGCNFGGIVRFTETVGEVVEPRAAIKGGIIHCGDQNWNMDDQLINLASDGVVLVYIEVEVEVNRDDDEAFLLPGVKTGTRPIGNWDLLTWDEDTDYPVNTSPIVTTGLGTIILPIGKLTVEDGEATMEPVGCGHFTITHCAGTLGYTRG